MSVPNLGFSPDVRTGRFHKTSNSDTELSYSIALSSAQVSWVAGLLDEALESLAQPTIRQDHLFLSGCPL